MRSQNVRVAVTQAEPAWLDISAAVIKTCELIEKASTGGAQLVAFPECWIPGYPCWIWSRPIDPELSIAYVKNSLKLDSPEIKQIQNCAKANSIAVALGFSERCNDSLYISQVIISAEGEIKTHRRKMKPTHVERTVFGDASGECFSTVVQLPFARVGALACWEHLQPLLKYHTISQQEDIHVGAWPNAPAFTGGPTLWSLSAEGCQTLSQVYAIESQCFVIHCTALITDKGIRRMNNLSSWGMGIPGGGFSAIFAPDGRRLTEPVPSTEEGMIFADLDMDLIVAAKLFVDVTGHYSRPDLISLNVDTRVKKLVHEEIREDEGMKAVDGTNEDATE